MTLGVSYLSLQLAYSLIAENSGCVVTLKMKPIEITNNHIKGISCDKISCLILSMFFSSSCLLFMPHDKAPLQTVLLCAAGLCSLTSRPASSTVLWCWQWWSVLSSSTCCSSYGPEGGTGQTIIRFALCRHENCLLCVNNRIIYLFCSTV